MLCKYHHRWIIFIMAVLRAASVQVEVLSPGASADATVSLFSHSSDSSPDFTGPIYNVTAAVGREATLSCSVTDLGQYKIAWARAEDQTILSLQTRVITHNPRITVSHDDAKTWQLKIRQLKETDRGCYMCQINTNSMKKQIGCVDVQGDNVEEMFPSGEVNEEHGVRDGEVPPDIVDMDTSSDVTVTEGDNATLVCRATGHPPPRILWRREDGNHLLLRNPNNENVQKVDTYSGSTLNLLQMTRRQMGAYLCIASNDVPPAVSKRITINVNFAPVVKVATRRLGAHKRSDAELICYIEAFPYLHTSWLKNGNEIHHDGKKFIFKETKIGYNINAHLVINNVSRWDYDVYSCYTSNEIGQADGSIKLYETKPPVVVTQPPTTTTPAPFIPETTTEKTYHQDEQNHPAMATSSTTETQTIIISVRFAEVSDSNSLPSVAPAPLETYVGLATSVRPTPSAALCFIISALLLFEGR